MNAFEVRQRIITPVLHVYVKSISNTQQSLGRKG